MFHETQNYRLFATCNGQVSLLACSHHSVIFLLGPLNSLSLQLGYSTVPEWICKTAAGNVWEMRIVSLPSCVLYIEQKWTECETGTKMPQTIQQVSLNLAFQIFISVMPCLCSFFLIFLDRLVLDLQISTVCPTVPTVCHVSGLQMSPRCIAFIATWIFNSPRVNLQDSWRQCVGNTYCFVTILRILNRNAQNVKQGQRCRRLYSR